MKQLKQLLVVSMMAILVCSTFQTKCWADAKEINWSIDPQISSITYLDAAINSTGKTVVSGEYGYSLVSNGESIAQRINGNIPFGIIDLESDGTTFIGITDEGAVKSEDGFTWKALAIEGLRDDSFLPTSLFWDGHQFCLVAVSKKWDQVKNENVYATHLFYSATGEIWHAGIIDLPINPVGAVSNGKSNLIIDTTGQIFKSDSGQDKWIFQNKIPLGECQWFSGNSDGFVAGGYHGNIFISHDGVTWIDQSVQGTEQLDNIVANGILHQGRLFIVHRTSEHDEILERVGNGFVNRHTERYYSLHQLKSFGSKVLGVGANGIISSTNGNIWTSLPAGPSYSLGSIVKNQISEVDGSLYVVASEALLKRDKGTGIWKERFSYTDGPAEGANSVFSMNGSAYMVDLYGVILKEQGESWVPVGEDVNDYKPLKIVAGKSNCIFLEDYTSTLSITNDFKKWDKLDSENLANVYDVFWAADHYVALCQDDRIFKSSDGYQWTQVTTNVPEAFGHISYSDSQYWGVTISGIVYQSSNGEKWSAIGKIPDADSVITSILHINNNLIAFTEGRGIWVKKDSETWREVILPYQIYSYEYVVINNRLYGAGMGPLVIGNLVEN